MSPRRNSKSPNSRHYSPHVAATWVSRILWSGSCNVFSDTIITVLKPPLYLYPPDIKGITTVGSVWWLVWDHVSTIIPTALQNTWTWSQRCLSSDGLACLPISALGLDEFPWAFRFLYQGFSPLFVMLKSWARGHNGRDASGYIRLEQSSHARPSIFNHLE